MVGDSNSGSLSGYDGSNRCQKNEVYLQLELCMHSSIPLATRSELVAIGCPTKQSSGANFECHGIVRVCNRIQDSGCVFVLPLGTLLPAYLYRIHICAYVYTRLWAAWNELDWKEESELSASHRTYDELKKRMEVVETQISNVDGGISSHVKSDILDTLEQDDQKKREDNSTTPRWKRLQSQQHPGDAGISQIEQKPVSSLPRLTDGTPLTLDWVTSMMDEFKIGVQLSYLNTVELLRRVLPLFEQEENVVFINIAPTARLTVVGDVHGQLADVLTLFTLNGLPSEDNWYLFNGDVVDRGQQSVECILTLFCFKVLYPKYIYINRGNHEAQDMNSKDGFEKECLYKYDQKIFSFFSSIFAYFPIAAVIDKKVFVVHGGISSTSTMTLDTIQTINRKLLIPPSGKAHVQFHLRSSQQVARARGPCSLLGLGLGIASDRIHQTKRYPSLRNLCFFKQIYTLNQHASVPGSILEDLLWSDPRNIQGVQKSSE